MEVDPVILQLRADNDRYLSELRRTTRTAEQQLGLQERRVKALETQMARSSGAIGNSLRGLGAVFAGAFSARALISLADSFTRLQNNLRVAGLEGEDLAKVQGDLLDLSQRYGVSIEGLSRLYGQATDAGRSFGASQADIFRLTEATSQALRITGTDAAQASGALLGLSQALASGVVRAEEYNQINEGGLRPLLQAAAATERFGGDVNRLRAAMLEGEVTSREFFDAILAGSEQLESRAAKATLTLSGGFEALNSALTVYFGEADKANGVSAALGLALQALADNLDTIIPALAVVATGLGVGYVTNAVSARIATVALGTAARATGASLLAAFGGPVGVAILAVGAGLAYVATHSETASGRIDQLQRSAASAAAEADAMEQRLRDAGVAMYQVNDAADIASGGINGVGSSAVSARRNLYDLQQQAIRTAVALVDLQIQENMRNRVSLDRSARNPEISQTTAGLALQGGSNRRETQLQAEIAANDEEFRQLQRKRSAIISGVVNGVDVTGAGGTSPAPAPTSTPSRPKSGSTKPSGPDPADLLRQFEDELAANRIRLISAQIDLATSAEEEARLRREQVTLAEQQTLASIAADEALTDAQREQLRLQVEAIANAEREAISAEERRQIARDAQDLADERYDAEREALRLQFDLATTDADRRDIALRILDAEDEYLRAKLQATIANQDLADIERQRAQMALDALNGTSGARREATRRQYAGPLERYAENAGDVDARVEEATVRQIKHMNGVIVDAISSELGVKDPFLRELFSIFLDENIFGPLAQALGQQGAGGGGLFSAIGTALGSLFGGARATGGPVNSGKAYLVGERGPELFMPNGAGNIVPNQRLAASTSQNGGVATVRLQLSGDIDARIDQRSTTIAVEVVRDASGPIINASAAETTRRLTRRTL